MREFRPRVSPTHHNDLSTWLALPLALSVLSACADSLSNEGISVRQRSQIASRAALASGPRIYVTNLLNNTVTVYKPNGKRTIPTIRDGIDMPRAVAVDGTGKIYVANIGNDTVTTYKPDGKRTTPTIRELHFPTGIAIDTAGKIYVTNYSSNSVTTYDSSGEKVQPEIRAGLNGPYGIAVDAGGKIYVSNALGSNVTTYLPNGSRSEPTIKQLDNPTGVALGPSGKIYVSSFLDNMVLTYHHSGKFGHPTITQGIGGPCFIATDDQRRIYVANYAPPPGSPPTGYVTVYSKRGFQATKLTISTGIDGPVGIAISK